MNEDLRAQGPDISTHQRSDSIPGEPNCDLLVDNEDFIFMKYCENKRTDVDLDWWYTHINRRKPVSGYCFANYVDWAAPQANYFCDLIERYPIDFPGVIDLEKTDYYGALPTAYKCVQWLLDFGDAYKARRKENPILYTNGAMILYLMKSNHPRLAELFEWPLWISYPGPEKYIRQYGYLGGWKDWTFWQYTWKMNGYENGVESADLDYNKFNGNAAAFLAWIKQEPAEIDIRPELDTISAAVMAIRGKLD